MLDEAVDQCADGPVKPGPSIRLALALLYSMSRTQDCRCFSDFWCQIQNPADRAYSEVMGQYERTAYGRTEFYRVARAVGYGETPEHWHAIRSARRGRFPPRNRSG